jgi:hypothetical protein
MKVAFGWKAHSGWAALVVLGKRGAELEVIDRQRVELVEKEWAKQPYHAAESLQPEKAREMVRRGVESARRIATREMRAAMMREGERGYELKACAVLMGNPMPDWSTEEILAVHFRMHKAEGVLFREALVGAGKACGLKVIELPERGLMKLAEKALGTDARTLLKRMSSLGKTVGPPWGKDQKEAALAALVVLSRSA